MDHPKLEALYKNLKNGETVQNDQGVAIPAPMVCSEDKPGRSVVLLPACNSADNIGPHAVRADIMIAAAGAAAAYDGGQIGAGLGMCAQQWGVRNLLVTAMPSSGSSSSSNNSSSTTRRQRSSSSSSEDGSQVKQQQEQSHLLDPAAAAALAAVAQQYTRGVVIPARDDMSIILEENLGELDPPPVDLEAVVAVARTTCLQGEKKAETTNEKSLQRRARRFEQKELARQQEGEPQVQQEQAPQQSQQQQQQQQGREGWVSGYIVAPAQCGPSISARACQRCITSKAPEPCITCAKSPQLKARLLDTVYGGIYELNPADGCGACYSSAAPEKCAACLYGKQPCAACALQPENSGALAARMDVAACIDCRCQNWCPTYDTRAKCNACLATKQDAYMTACACS
ncbi:hypothetical protein OEZ85_010786 [Tetradesmus obliquus]|uniref:Uncharacterized protein n=1 Tax=Tetradesmus obliquus TaxID=3088 RepID=A0ABY8TNB9_TETOB|nr:hypothetical protein OEZ85_010786 [Tetradesmus obliquus]